MTRKSLMIKIKYVTLVDNVIGDECNCEDTL